MEFDMFVKQRLPKSPESRHDDVELFEKEQTTHVFIIIRCG